VKVGDLVKILFQPACSGFDKKRQCVRPMKHAIKGEFGIVAFVGLEEHPRYSILFPQFGSYKHWLAPSAFEVVSENR
jgi:hypothetical protein